MKTKLTTLSLLVLAFLIATTAVQAQKVWTYQADIPFDFFVGDSAYDAGEFIIDLERPNYLANILTIRNVDRDRLQRNALLTSGRRSDNENTRLVFDRFEDVYVLREIVAPNFGFRLPRSGTRTWTVITKNNKKDRETIAVILERPQGR